MAAWFLLFRFIFVRALWSILRYRYPLLSLFRGLALNSSTTFLPCSRGQDGRGPLIPVSFLFQSIF